VQPVGSLDGLTVLHQGIAQISACHLLDASTGKYNQPYERHIFPDVTLASRSPRLRHPAVVG